MVTALFFSRPSGKCVALNFYRLCYHVSESAMFLLPFSSILVTKNR